MDRWRKSKRENVKQALVMENVGCSSNLIAVKGE